MKTLRWLAREYLQIILLALPFVLAAAWWNKFPPVVATHWGIDGRPNGWMPKAPGLLAAPVLNVFLCSLFVALPWIDPRLRRDPATQTARQRWVRRAVRYAITAFIAIVSVAIILVAAGWPVDMGRLAYNGVLTLLAITGNFLGSLRPNNFMGIRTPWTLKDAGTWRATHRITGRAMVFGAVSLLMVGFFVSSRTQVFLLIASVVTLAIWTLGYSFWFFQRRRLAG